MKVNTDHKPLESIFKKDLAAISARLQRMRFRLISYTLSVVYKPGKYLYISDTFSRAFLCQDGLKSDREYDFAVHCLEKKWPMSDLRKAQFKNILENDLELKTVVYYCNSGWPESRQKVPDFIIHYFKLKDSLSFIL